ncbi:hypothetical protein JCM10908_006300 [Rhodotorula pacifica]|uniref:F-box protein n=1 Tax=Rhodotorula pacifica TaxID=1495444 RepID=UPI00317FA170
MPKRPRTDAAASPSGVLHNGDAFASGSSASGAATSSRRTGLVATKREVRGLKFKATSPSEQPRKRLATTSAGSTVLPIRSLEGSLSEEVLLRCLSFLSAHDLVTVSRVSSAWHRLAQDPQLWRKLYLRTYASSAIRRQAALGAAVARSRPWRELYQISTNWRNGSARATTLGTELRRAVLPSVPADTAVVEPDELHSAPPTRSVPAVDPPDDTLLQFHQQFIFSASRSASSGDDAFYPTVTVHQTLSGGGSTVVGSFGSERLRQFYHDKPDFRPSFTLSEMRLDASGSLLALFYSTGQYALFRLTFPSEAQDSPFSAREVYTSLATGLAPHYHDPSLPPPSSLFDPVTTARLHWPLLVTLTESLTLRFLRLSEVAGDSIEVDETETPLQSRERWSPVVLSLVSMSSSSSQERDGKADSDAVRFRVSLAYSTPIFPASWTVGMQQFDVSVSSTSPLVIRAQHATAPPLHTPLPSMPRRTALFASGDSPFSAPAPSKSPVTSIEHSHPFIVTSRVDNTIDVYEVLSGAADSDTLPSTQNLPSRKRHSTLQIVHRRTLFGHTARVGSVALLPTAAMEESAASPSLTVRCISAGDDGAVKVWHLSPHRLNKRRRSGTVADLQVEIRGNDARSDEFFPTSSPSSSDIPPQLSDWQRLKRRRMTGHGSLEGEQDRPLRVKRVWVDEDKIVLLQHSAGSSDSGGAAGGGVEAGSIQVLRFD